MLIIHSNFKPEKIGKPKALLPEELKRIDEILSDEMIFSLFSEFKTNRGRPYTPMFIRMMYIKHRYNLSFESLEKETSDSVSFRGFCHIPFEKKVPDPSTLAL